MLRDEQILDAQQILGAHAGGGDARRDQDILRDEQTLGAHRGQDMLREEHILRRRSSHWLEAHVADDMDGETSVAACAPRPATDATSDTRRRRSDFELLAGNGGRTVEREDSERASEPLEPLEKVLRERDQALVAAHRAKMAVDQWYARYQSVASDLSLSQAQLAAALARSGMLALSLTRERASPPPEPEASAGRAATRKDSGKDSSEDSSKVGRAPPRRPSAKWPSAPTSQPSVSSVHERDPLSFVSLGGLGAGGGAGGGGGGDEWRRGGRGGGEEEEDVREELEFAQQELLLAREDAVICRERVLLN